MNVRWLTCQPNDQQKNPSVLPGTANAWLERKPAVLVSGSAIGWYGLWQDQVLTELAKSHACFSHELCDAWENAPRPAKNMACAWSVCGSAS